MKIQMSTMIKSSIPSIFKRRTITSHPNWTHWTQKRHDMMTSDVGYPDISLGQVHKYWRG